MFRLPKVEEITPGRSIAKLTVASGDVYHLDSLTQVDLVTSLAENNGKEVVFTDRQLEESVGEIRYNKARDSKEGAEYQIVLGDGTRVYLNAQTTRIVSRKVLLIASSVWCICPGRLISRWLKIRPSLLSCNVRIMR